MVVSLLIYYLLITAFHLPPVSGQTFSFSQPATGPSSVCEGSDVTLHCVVVISNPDNTVTVQGSVWSRNEMPVQVTNTSGTFTLPNHNQVYNSATGGFTDLVITNVTLEDDNIVYTCTATGATITSSVVLNVTDPLAKPTLSVDDTGVDSFSISWSSPAQSVCQGISYNITLSIVLDNGRYEMMPTFTSITVNITYHNFTGVNNSTSYLVEVIPIYNGLEGNINSITVRAKDQPSSVVTIPTQASTTNPSATNNVTDILSQQSGSSTDAIVIIIPVVVAVVVLTIIVIIVISLVIYWRKAHKEGPNDENKEDNFAQPNGNAPQQETSDDEYAFAINGPRGVVFPLEMPQQQ